MTGTNFKMDLGPLSKAFTGAVKHMADTSRLTAEIGEALVASTRQRFRDETGPDGEEWKPSARASAEGGRILTDTARLKNSIGYEATSTEVAVGTNVKYAAIHQHGGEIKAKSAKALAFEIGGKKVFVKKVEMPARPFLGISEEDKEEAREIIHDWMARGFKK